MESSNRSLHILFCPASRHAPLSRKPLRDVLFLPRSLRSLPLHFLGHHFPTLWRWRFDAETGADWAKTDDIMPWEQKVNVMGWRGSSNENHAMDDNCRQFQRHRTVKLANGVVWKGPYELQSTESLQRWLDVHFTNIAGCDEPTCQVMREESPVVEG
jgi:hypothetical protein